MAAAATAESAKAESSNIQKLAETLARKVAGSGVLLKPVR
jgi:hypothetical protein